MFLPYSYIEYWTYHSLDARLDLVAVLIITHGVFSLLTFLMFFSLGRYSTIDSFNMESNNSSNVPPTQVKKRKINNDDSAAQAEVGGSEILSLMKQMMCTMSSMQNKLDLVTHKLNNIEAKHDKLEAKNLHLESSLQQMSDRQRYNEVLLKNQKWKYPTDIWKPEFGIGHRREREQEREQVERGLSFIAQIKKATCEMRYGITDGNTVQISDSHHDHARGNYMPHWQEFAHALEEYKYYLQFSSLPRVTKSTFEISSVHLPHDVIGLLSKALRDTYFDSFILEYNSMMGSVGFDFAIRYVHSNTILKDFTFNENPINSREDLSQLCDVIKMHPTLESISMIAGSSGDDITGNEMLCCIIDAGGNKLKQINLSDNSINTGRSSFLHDFLVTNPVLQKLILRENHIDDVDAKFLALALRNNTNLEYLDLTDNPLTAEGVKQLMGVEFDETSLNAAAASNHTCRIINPHCPDFNGCRLTNPDDQPFEKKALRAKKIYILLSRGNMISSNVQKMGDADVELLPMILSSIQKYSTYHIGDHAPNQHYDDVNALSLVYEFMRHWDKAISALEL